MVLGAPAPAAAGTTIANLRGDVDLRHVVVTFGDKAALKDVSISVKAGARTAVIGPTAAGTTARADQPPCGVEDAGLFPH